jgi:hypothetical protein
MYHADVSKKMSKIPPNLTALGRRTLPGEINVGGRRYTLREVFKNDFFAITALYDGNANGKAGKVILKVHRRAPFLLIPLRWVGRLLCAKECAAFAQLGDVEGVPRLLERWESTGVIREYIEGHPLARDEHVADDFHERLRALVNTIHQRDMAYVDLEKSENVLVGDDGKPHLFDFQISWYWPKRWGGALWPMRVIRRCLQEGDLYHLGKLHRRSRPDQLTDAQRAATYCKPWHVAWHHPLTYPFTWCRRLVLHRIDPKRAGTERGRILKDPLIGARNE